MDREKGRPARSTRSGLGGFAGFTTGLALAVAALAGHAADYRRGPPPPWVIAQPLDEQAKAPLGKGSQGVHYLLVDQQTRIEGPGKTAYRRVASRTMDLRGVESESHLSLEFDPSYETLTLHTLKVHRDGRVQDRLPGAQVKVLQRESELESRVYDGSKTLDVVLDDVRPGDIVEYAYSRAGNNPVFGGRTFGHLDMQWSVPVHALHQRLLVPSNRPLQLRPWLIEQPARVEQRGDWTEHSWTAADIAPTPRQGDTPRWYDPYAGVSWSEYADWAAVARWAEPLYDAPAPAAGPLRTEIDRIAAAAATPDQRLLSVLAFVQSQIRYLGIEVGPGSHAPRPPEAVLARRYGDCKDKVLLAVTMLRALGVAAHPALVSTRLRDHVGDRLPSPGVFNHVILRAQVDGRDVWVDPTRYPQAGRLDEIAQADFGQALVLDGRTQSLAAMPAARAATGQHDVVVAIDASRGFDQPATLDVTVTYRGEKADDMRETLRNDSLADLQANYLNFYLRSIPGLTVAGPFSFDDDEKTNRLVTREHYRVASLASKDPDDKGRPIVYLRVPDVGSLLERPDDTVRSAPLHVQHPKDVTVSVTTVLPEPWDLRPSSHQVSNPAFEFTADTGLDKDRRTLQMKYRYRTLSDHVMPDQLPAYIADLRRARDRVGYTLHPKRPHDHAPRDAWPDLRAATLLLLLLVAAAAWIVDTGNRRPAPLLPWEDWQLLLTGAGLLGLPVLMAFATLAVMLVSPHWPYGGAGWLAASLLALLWNRAWSGPWLRWADARSADPRRLLAAARSLVLMATGRPLPAA